MRWLAACLLAAFMLPALAAEEVISIPTRPGVTVSYLLVSAPSAKPRIIVVSFVGGRGVINLAERSAKGALRFGPGANFLVRVRDEFANADMADALIDAPSDQLPNGMDDAFRMSDAHAQDVGAVIADLLKRYPESKVYAMGTSRGTTSAATLGARQPALFAGIVLSSTVTVADRTGPNLSRFDWSSLRVPVLLVHHRDDACRSSPYGGVERLASRFALTTVEGGDPPKSDACEPQSAHGYLGREKATSEAIRRWITSGTPTPLVQ
ncbi:MAG TPA: alpha/beta hydrolase [Casimicrobiaceae bacterium]|nr:alpha/beta hydrolase [Casimicrobiaceae bacterium]